VFLLLWCASFQVLCRVTRSTCHSAQQQPWLDVAVCEACLLAEGELLMADKPHIWL
jgi:hypothetical protein